MPVLALISTGATGSGESVLPAAEIALFAVSFAGFGLGAAIAVPLYALRRWPGIRAGGPPGGATDTVARLTAVACAMLALPQLYWGLGGTVGLQQTATGRDTPWHLLTLNNGIWALAGAWAVWTLARPGAHGRVPLLTAWVASGFLFARGGWRATFMPAVAPVFTPPEHLWVLALQNQAGALAGLAMLLVTLLAVGGGGEQDPARRGSVLRPAGSCAGDNRTKRSRTPVGEPSVANPTRSEHRPPDATAG